MIYIDNINENINYLISSGTLFSAKVPGVDTRLFLSNTKHIIQGGVQVALPAGFYDVNYLCTYVLAT